MFRCVAVSGGDGSGTPRLFWKSDTNIWKGRGTQGGGHCRPPNAAHSLPVLFVKHFCWHPAMRRWWVNLAAECVLYLRGPVLSLSLPLQTNILNKSTWHFISHHWILRNWFITSSISPGVYLKVTPEPSNRGRGEMLGRGCGVTIKGWPWLSKKDNSDTVEKHIKRPPRRMGQSHCGSQRLDGWRSPI